MPPASSQTETRLVQIHIDGHAVVLVAAALHGEADRLRRAAVTLSGELDEERRGTGKDIRQGALAVVKVLAEADQLLMAAAALEEGWELGFPVVEISDPNQMSLLATPDLDEPPPDPSMVATVDGATVGHHLHDPDVARAREALGIDPTSTGEDDDDEGTVVAATGA